MKKYNFAVFLPKGYCDALAIRIGSGLFFRDKDERGYSKVQEGINFVHNGFHIIGTHKDPSIVKEYLNNKSNFKYKEFFIYEDTTESHIKSQIDLYWNSLNNLK